MFCSAGGRELSNYFAHDAVEHEFVSRTAERIRAICHRCIARTWQYLLALGARPRNRAQSAPLSDLKSRCCLKTQPLIELPKGVAQNNKKPAEIAGLRQTLPPEKNSGAGEGARTLDPDLGKVVLYH